MGLGSVLGKLNPIAGILGGIASGQAQNRGNKLSGQYDIAALLNQREMQRQQLLAGADNDYTANQLGRSQEGRASGQDAWRKLLSAQHTMSPGARPQLAGPYNVAPRQATAAEGQGADALTQEVMARLQGGNPIAPVTKRPVDLAYDPMSTIDPTLLDPSKSEKWMGYLSSILGGASAYGQK